jgi:CPA2 family monovalent cation:H+ antiporter-2
VEHGPWLKDVLVFLAAAGFVVPLFHRARIGAVLGFLLVGVVVGPYGLGQFAADYPWVRYVTIEDRERVEMFAEIGVMFLLFLIGLEMSIERLWSLRRFVLGIGGIQFTLSTLAIGAAVAAFGTRGGATIVLGLCLAMSSTAIVMQLLEEQGRSATLVGRIAFSVLLFQDLMVAPVLLVTQVLGRGGEGIAFALAVAVMQAVLAVVLIAGAGRYVLRPLFRFAGRTGSRELIMAMTLLIVLGIAGATGYAGLSTALGAFLAGLLLSETEYRHEIEIDLAPVKGLLIGLFFVSVGMTVDLRAVWAGIGTVLALVAILFAIKAIILYIASRAFRVGTSAAAEVAVLLAQAGEFAFIVIGFGRSLDLLTSRTAQLATAVAGISMMLTPLLAICGRWLARRVQHIDHGHNMPSGHAVEMKDHVVIGGYGRVGQTVARLLASENVAFIALDTNGELVNECRRRGDKVYFGDAGRRELLERVGAEQASAFVVTVNAPLAAERMVAAVRRKRPDALIFARARDAEHAVRLRRLGAVAVIPEAVEASLQLGGELLEALGIPDDAVQRRLAELRNQELGRSPGDEKSN